MNPELECKSAAEVVINYEPGVDYEAIKVDSGVEIRIKNSRLERLYGSTVKVYSPSKCYYYLFTIFIGEYTHSLLEKYVQAFTRLRELGFNAVVYVYDCDPETSVLLNMVDRIADFIANKDFVDVIKIASLVVLVRRFAERARDLKYKALQDSRYYYEYQEALASFSKYVSMLLKLLGSPEVLETLLETPIEARFWRSKVFDNAFGGLVNYYSADFYGECPNNVVAGLESACSSILRGERVCIVTAEQVAKHVSSILPQCVFVPVSLKA